MGRVLVCQDRKHPAKQPRRVKRTHRAAIKCATYGCTCTKTQLHSCCRSIKGLHYPHNSNYRTGAGTVAAGDLVWAAAENGRSRAESVVGSAWVTGTGLISFIKMYNLALCACALETGVCRRSKKQLGLCGLSSQTGRVSFIERSGWLDQ